MSSPEAGTCDGENSPSLFGAAVAAWPLAARGQVNRVRRIGVLMALAADDPEALARVKGFKLAWPELRSIRGQNIQVDYRWALHDLRNVASDLVASSPDVNFGYKHASLDRSADRHSINPDCFCRRF